MKVNGEHRFTHSCDEVWKALLDPAALTATLPGARRLEPTGSDEYLITVDVGVGSVRGTYDGTFALKDMVEREACTVTASASGRPGSVTAVAQMRLATGDDGHAVMTYEADANVTGPLAGVGQRLMGAAARRTTEQFLEALDRYIEAPTAAQPTAAAAEPGAAVVPAAAPAPTGAKVIVASALGGFTLALIGVAVGRWTARR
jgi:carbon monoxide dehydrogenase subunit G